MNSKNINKLILTLALLLMCPMTSLAVEDNLWGDKSLDYDEKDNTQEESTAP